MSITITLIQTSQNRKDELTKFIHSLNNQNNINFSSIQLIFIDQGNNSKIFDNLCPYIDFKYIKTDKCSLSHARNLGIKHVKGKYIGFPDDDCWYEPDTLNMVLSILKEGKYQGVTGKGSDEKGTLTSIFPICPSELTLTNRCAAISYTLFLKFDKTIKFDEDMGIGSPYNLGAGEETDYLLSLMEQKQYKVYYDPSISIHHPTSNIYSKSEILKRSYSYARGAGYLMRKHNFSIDYIIKQFIRPFGGIFIHFLKFDYFSCHRSYLIFKGKIEGYFWRKNDNISR